MDSIESHKKFAASHGLNFPLVSDPAPHPISKAYGVLQRQAGVSYDKRTTFVIGKDGTIAKVFPDVQIDGHVERVMEAIKAL